MAMEEHEELSRPGRDAGAKPDMTEITREVCSQSPPRSVAGTVMRAEPEGRQDRQESDR